MGRALLDHLVVAAATLEQGEDYIEARVGTWDAANADLQALCATIGRDNPGWSGAVGKEVHAVMACFASGNIAEKMNHVGNFFIDILASDLIDAEDRKLTAWLTQAKLDVKALMRRRDESADAGRDSAQGRCLRRARRMYCLPAAGAPPHAGRDPGSCSSVRLHVHGRPEDVPQDRTVQ